MLGSERLRTWIDSHTHHKVTRITTEPGCSTLYFNYNAYTPQGDYFVITTPRGLARIHITTLDVSDILVIEVPFRLLFTSSTRREAFYELHAIKGQRGGAKTVMAVDIDSGSTRKIVDMESGDIQAINADDTLIAAVETAPSDAPIAKFFAQRTGDNDHYRYEAKWPDGTAMTHADATEVYLNAMLEARIPKTIFVVDLKSGERRDVYTSTDWLNHLLFSPVDPGLLMFCHEGPWHKVDRLWLLRVDSPNVPAPTKLHARTMNMEIAGHEWWSQDGTRVWFDLQTPRGEVFWIAGYEIATGKRVWYRINRDWWSVHFHSSPDDSRFVGDGGSEDMVAKVKDGRWLTLMTPHRVPDVAGIKAPNEAELVSAGYCTAERLVNMAEHDYHKCEPCGRFSPDGTRLFFQGCFGGERHIYVVDLEREDIERSRTVGFET